MVELEVDGIKVEVPEGSMLMDAAEKAGQYVPHFCYHKKLSIAANCRMCLVDVEKAPKPLPACATPVSQGMIVRTRSEKAIQAQKSVMEFLLINHPLDCPICDQGGECQLQDLAVGYGGVGSRYQEEKRVVFYKDIGPLVSAQEMSRCIHCTRCVRFGQEVAGVMELGMAGRGEHSEILSFVGNSVDSELSGNMIDLCPVGALTSKPFRYQARTWELARRRSVATHDSLGSNVVVQVKNDQVLRVVPFDNEAVNECWLSDRDRFSYEGLNAPDRLTEPMIKKGGQWVATDWHTALNVAFEGLKKARRESADLNQLACMVSPNASYEEMVLAKALMNGLGSSSIDAGLRHDAHLQLQGGLPWLGGSIEAFAAAQSLVVVGSDLRNDQPLLAHRVRQAAKEGAAVVLVAAGGQDSLIPKARQLLLAPSQWAAALQSPAVHAALAQAGQGERFVVLGQQVLMSPYAQAIVQEAQALAAKYQARVGFLGDGANWLGAFVAGVQACAQPEQTSIHRMVERKAKAVLVFGCEPELDAALGQKVMRGLADAEFVVQACAYLGNAKQYADVLLPIAPSTETSGTYINMAGVVQTVKATVKPLGETRPGWKVLRVLANLLGLPGFDWNSTEDILKAHPPQLQKLGETVLAGAAAQGVTAQGVAAQGVASEVGTAPGLELASYVPIYDVDAVVRRAPSLRKTKAAKPAVVQMNANTMLGLNVQVGSTVKLQDALGGTVHGHVACNPWVADNTVLVPVGRAETLGLRALFGAVSVHAHAAHGAEVQA